MFSNKATKKVYKYNFAWKYKEKEMSKKFLMFVFAFLLLSISASFVSAMPNIAAIAYDEPDLFYSNYAGNNIIHVNITVQNSSALLATFANFSNITTSCGNNGVVNFTSRGAGIYNASCNIGTAGNLPLGTVIGGPLIFVAVEQTDPTHPAINITGMGNSPLIHNLGVPQMPPASGCQSPQRFGSSTTNFTQILNFNSVNFIIQTEFNGSCIHGPGGGTSPWEGFQQIVMLNFSSLNMTSQEIGTKLQGLKDALQVNITPPHQFGLTRIYVNETAFAELNSNVTITLNNLPFSTLPRIVPDNASRVPLNLVFTNQTPWSITTPDGQIFVPNGNLRFTVAGFSGYNETDNVTPRITIAAPTANTSNPTTIVNVRVNGTITEPSQININFAGTDYYYNSSGNTALCSNISADKETYDCVIGPVPLSDNQYTVTVNAWDYGGTDPNGPGNTDSSSFTFIKDSTAPSISGEPSTSPLNGSAYSSSQVYQINVTATDGQGVGVKNVIMTFNGTNYTMASAGSGVYTNSSIKNLSAGTYAYSFWYNDTLGNNQGGPTYLYTVSQATPTLILTNYTALSVTYGNFINATGTCPAPLVCNLSRNGVLLGSLSDKGAYGAGSYTYVFNTTGNANYTAGSSSLNFTINQNASDVRLSLNGSRSGKSVPINSTLLINATLAVGVGSITITNNGAIIYSGTTPYAGNLTNFTSLGTFTITANYSGNTNYTSAIETWLVNVYDPSYSSNVNSSIIVTNQTQIIVNNATLLQNITIPQGSNQTVVIDMNSLVGNNSNVTIGAISVNVVRTDNSSGANYTLIIPANTNISGGASWDGKLTLPVVNTSSFTAPSSGTSPVVIDLGSSVELNFSNPVKIVIGGVGTGKKAAWSRGSATLTAISTQCTNETTPGITSGECHYNYGNDMIIWTYHFTSFASYTPAVTTTPPTTPTGGATGCTTTWTCGDWGACTVNETQTRTCSKVLSYCYAPEMDKPYETRPCTYTAPVAAGNETVLTAEEIKAKEEAKEAAVKAKSTIAFIIIGIVAAIVIIALVVTQLKRKKKFF